MQSRVRTHAPEGGRDIKGGGRTGGRACRRGRSRVGGDLGRGGPPTTPSDAGSGLAGEKESGVAGAGLTCPLGPGTPDSPCKHKEARSPSGGVQRPPAASPATPTQPAHLLAFLSGEAGHPRVALQMENRESEQRLVCCAEAVTSPRPHLASRPIHPPPQRSGRLEAREVEVPVLTTPPRGPVFPGTPWRKKGVADLVSFPQPRLPATLPRPPAPPQGVIFLPRFGSSGRI